MKSDDHAAWRARPPVKDGWESPRRIQSLALLVATALGVAVSFHLALPFAAAFAWALALAVLFAPVHGWLERQLRQPSLAALTSVLLAGLIVAGPTVFVGQRLIVEATKGAELIRTKVESGEWRRAVQAQPRLAPIADWIERRADPPGTLKDLATWLTVTTGAIVRGSVVQVIGFALTLYLLFYFLRDRQVALASLRLYSPLTHPEMDRLYARIADTIFATVYGTLVVAAVQGLLGGLIFWWLGLPVPLLWGVVMGLLALVPVLGAFVVWIPAALFLALEGNWIGAVVLTVWGAVVIGGIHNVLYPILVGNRLQMHSVPAFIAMVGGLILFGSAGLILGPVALTITSVLLEVWRNRAAGRAPAKPRSRTQPAPATTNELDEGCPSEPAQPQPHARADTLAPTTVHG